MPLDDAPFIAAAASSAAREPVPALPDAPFVPPASPDMSGAARHFASVRAADSFTDYLEAGWQQSVAGLAVRGKAPDVAPGPESPWYGRLATSLAGIAGDSPAILGGFGAGLVAGGVAGSAVPVIGNAAGATVGSFAGAGALPAALRTVMMDHYEKGDIGSSAEFVERALHTSWETFKGATIGAATGGAGVAAKAAIPAVLGATAANIGLKTAAGATAAEIAAMATVGKGLEGKLPEPKDFLDAGLVIGGARGAGAAAGKLRMIYAATGKQPAEVLADAQANPALLEQLASDKPMIEIPDEYKPAAIAETARSAVPDYRSNEAAALDATAVMQRPFAELPKVEGEPDATHVNYDFINSSDDVKASLARLSDIYTDRIQQQRRGTVSWEQTSNEAAAMLADNLGGVDTKLVMPREPGTAAGAAEILARKQLTIGAAEDMVSGAKDFMAKGANASPEDTAAFLAKIERASLIQSEFLGARAEAGRAMNVLKNTAMDAERSKQIKNIVDMYGKDPQRLAVMIGDMDNPASALKFAKEAAKATTWDKMIEAWKAGLLTGPVTHVANVLGNGAFLAMRAPIDAIAAGIGIARGAAVGDRVSAMEPVGGLASAFHGSLDAVKIAVKNFRTGETFDGKSEQQGGAIQGKLGTAVRLPFRLLTAEDAVFKELNYRRELSSLAFRQASAEGLNPLTREYRERVATLLQNPTDAADKAATEAANRFTFNEELGDKGKAVQKFVRSWHLEWLVPFIRTPANILKELTRMTPFAPLVGEWRAAIKEGGVARDKAIAELAMGSSLMSLVFLKALDGTITGSGEPDAGKKRVQLAAGWQPYSVKIGNKYYSYDRIQPIGTMMGLAADMATAWDHMNEDESDKIPKILATAFANAVTNQTFLQGITNIVNAVSDPTRFAPKFFQGLAGSVVPANMSQLANTLDPTARQVDSMLDAVKSRIPGLRQSLMPKRDVFGEPEANKDRVGFVSPVVQRTESDDKVRTEADRLGISVADTPKKTHLGRGSGKIGDVKLTPEQRDTFADVGGHLAHQILEPIVNSDTWDALPDLVKTRIYAKAFREAHIVGANAAIPAGAQRDSLMNQITEKLTAELAPSE